MAIVNIGFSEFLEDNIKEITDKYDWMKTRTFKLCKTIEEFKEFIDKAIEFGHCVLDLETNGLSTRIKKVDNKIVSVTTIVGFCLCYDTTFAIYVPINHLEDAEYNLPEKKTLDEIKRLCTNCKVIFHNAKYDVALLKNYGIIISDYKMFEDTIILGRLYDAGTKETGLKKLSEKLLNQPMLELKEVTGGENRFDLISPNVGYIYGGSDAICTFDLYKFFEKQDIIKQQEFIYNLEKRIVFVVIEMESHLIKINIPYLLEIRKKAEERIEKLTKEVYELVNHEFNIDSPLQLGKILFDELEYEYPQKRKTTTGQYITDDKTMKKIAEKYPLVQKILEYRNLKKLTGTYIKKLLLNTDKEGFVKLSFNQVGTDTGRFSSPGGAGLEIDGYSGVNFQSMPKKPDKKNPELDLRKAFTVRDPSKTMVAIDYENEEMRVATNLSNETVWIDAIKKGVDFHTATGALVSGKNVEDIGPDSPERRIGKTVNFLSLYLGGPYNLSEQAGISITEAKRILTTYFSGVPRLKKWMEREIARSHKSKIVKTVFGRIRPLNAFYDSDDKTIISHGDRCVINSEVQGCLQPQERCLTTKGYLPIIKIKDLKDSGHNIKVWTGTTWENFDVLDRGEADLAEIELKNGMKIEIDTRHEVLIEDIEGYRFEKYENLNENTKICVSVPQVLKFGDPPSNFPFHCWKAFSYILGALVKSGFIENENEITLTLDSQYIEETLEYLKSEMSIYETKISQKDNNIKIYYKNFSLIFNSNFNMNSKKEILKFMLKTPIYMRQKFLEGFNKSENNINLDRDILRDVQLLGWVSGTPFYIKEDNGHFSLIKFDNDNTKQYYSFPLKYKRNLNRKGNTYTLAVHSDLHRFDSAGIISKNTCADIMKIVMAKLHAWIHRNNFQDDIKILITMHDELVFEITTEKLNFLIPEIVKIMMLKDVITNKLKWEIPLTVDVKYGQNWRVEKNFFEDFPELKKNLDTEIFESNPVLKEEPEKKNEKAELDSDDKNTEEKEIEKESEINNQTESLNSDPSIKSNNSESSEFESETSTETNESTESLESNSDSHTKENLTGAFTTDKYLVYEIRNRDWVNLRWLNDILTFFIKDKSEIYQSQKKILKLRDSEGNSLLVDEFEVPVDAFLALAKFFGI